MIIPSNWKRYIWNFVKLGKSFAVTDKARTETCAAASLLFGGFLGGDSSVKDGRFPRKSLHFSFFSASGLQIGLDTFKRYTSCSAKRWVAIVVMSNLYSSWDRSRKSWVSEWERENTVGKCVRCAFQVDNADFYFFSFPFFFAIFRETVCPSPETGVF